MGEEDVSPSKTVLNVFVLDLKQDFSLSEGNSTPFSFW